MKTTKPFINTPAREKHVADMDKVKFDLDCSIKGTPHYRDTKKCYEKMRQELRLYDELMCDYAREGSQI